MQVTTPTPLDAAEVLRVYRDAVVVDGSIAPVMDRAQIDRMLASGVTAVNWTVPRPFSDLHQSLAELARAIELVEAHPGELLLVRTVADIERAKAEGKVGLIFGPQNARPCEEGLHLFRIFHQLGVRILQLTYNERNAYGDGAGEPASAGLSLLGREAIAEMNRLGIVIDLSHCGDRTTEEAIAASTRPVIVSHANSRALLDSPRNKTDEQLRMVAAGGGVVGLTLWSPMLAFDHRPTLEDFVRHVDHVARLIGVEHIAIGSDHSEGAPRDRWEREFGSGGKYPSITGRLGSWYGYDTRFAEQASSIVDFPRIAAAIAQLGFTEAELGQVLGGNLLRVFRQVWGA